MKIKHLLLSAFIFGGLTANAQIWQGFFKGISKWPDGKKAAVSLTFDDNLSGQFTYALPLLSNAGYRGSFYVIAGQGPWANANVAAVGGHEIGSHSWSHLDLTGTSINLTRELKESRDTIDANILTQKCRTIAWPLGRGGGSTAAEAIVRDSAEQYYLGARNAGINSNKYEPWNIKRYYQVGAWLIDNSVTDTAYATVLDSAIANNGWVVPMYHAIEDPGYALISGAKFGSQLQRIATRDDKLWVAPFAEVLGYARRRNSYDILSVPIPQPAPIMGFSFIMTDTSSEKVYNPGFVEINVEVPFITVPGPNVYQMKGRNGVVYIDSMIDMGSYTVKIPVNDTIDVFFLRSNSISKTFNPTAFKVYPNPGDGSTIKLKADNISEELHSVEILNSLGAVVESNVSFIQNADEYNVSFGKSLQSGVYFIKTQSGNSRTVIHKYIVR